MVYVSGQKADALVLQLLLELQESFSVSVVCGDCFSEVGDFMVGEVEGEFSSESVNLHVQLQVGGDLIVLAQASMTRLVPVSLRRLDYACSQVHDWQSNTRKEC